MTDSKIKDFFRDVIFGDPMTALGFVGVVLFLLVALFAPIIAPQNPYDLGAISIMDGQLAPGESLMDGTIAIFGTDEQGRDILSTIIYGLRISLFVAITASTIGTAIGIYLGLISAYYGGVVDSIVMRLVDVKMSFPGILLALMLLALMGQGVEKVILALIIGIWASKARVTRSAALGEIRKEYMRAAQLAGLSANQIILRYLLPNSIAPVIVMLPMIISGAIAAEATLSFLGVGVPITEPSLGMLIANGFDYLLTGYWWISILPGVVLVVLVLCINVVADRIREYANPALRHETM
ncbi:MAG: ABC transporter permease [Cohaesibacter sp.]|nr:ABC transporter permease [Cohaesibacter sp.]